MINDKLDAAGAAAFAADALAGLSLRAGLAVPNASDHQRRIARAPLMVLAANCLKAQGWEVDSYGAIAEDLLDACMNSTAGRRHVVAGGVSAGVSAEDAYNRPGSFPNLLSGLANKILDEGFSLAKPTYPEWAGLRAEPLRDFKPAPIVNVGGGDELDLVTDGERIKDMGLEEEMLAYIQLGRFANAITFTPVMFANDDLQAFKDNGIRLAMAHENSLNRLCLAQLAGNPDLLDGTPLFDAAHGNVIAGGSGGVPSDAEWSDMDNLVAAQTDVGGTGYVREPLAIALVPPVLERAAIQTFATPSVVVEVKTPTTDANLNIYRGRVKTVREADLQLYSSAIWYGLMQPQGTLNATVIYVYFRGWEAKGRRETWYDPNTKCLKTSLEGRFAAAAKQYRTIVRNAGA